MKRHPISERPPRSGRYLVGSKSRTWFGSYYTKHFGPWMLETDGTLPGEPLEWWAYEPKPGLHPRGVPK